ncbi:sensor domain-containing protein [Ensifer sp. ENS06]|uniref:sensor domain-containing protein n=1 Tax=Ensifer sp. ENS06 TaxID=2769276 RepID=UPI001785A222|nr:bifunctional diguanylate cyclase/phosphodiesterase [Ensifer sp. ENS06]
MDDQSDGQPVEAQTLAKLAELECALAEKLWQLELALDCCNGGLWDTDLKDGSVSWDRRVHELYGVPYNSPAALLTNEAWLTALDPGERKAAQLNMAASSADGGPYSQLGSKVLPTGQVRHLKTVAEVRQLPSGKRKLVGMVLDITDHVELRANLKAARLQTIRLAAKLEQARSRSEYSALHDPLTGLANRRKLDEELARHARRSRGNALKIGILHLNLDRFKQINDTLGHAVGDAILVHAAGTLRNTVSPENLIARIGSDEFVILVRNICDKEELAELACRVIALMRQPFEYNGHVCRFSVSIGIDQSEGKNLDTHQILVRADLALCRAKELGRGRYEFFAEILQAEMIEEKRIADDILAGIENDEFIPFYQPQIDAATFKLAGLEALIRWQHPRDGLLAPQRFLKTADAINATATLDSIILKKVLQDRVRFSSLGLNVPKVSVNVSARRLADPALVDRLADLAITPGTISFELLESIFLDDNDDILMMNIEKLKGIGIDIEIDDFGSGHTSIVSLLKLKPKRLKIDRQLVAPILSCSEEQALVSAIIFIGHSLGIEVVAEGVETLAHAQMLKTLGCDLLQGYAFAAPLSGEDLLAFHSTWHQSLRLQHMKET